MQVLNSSNYHWSLKIFLQRIARIATKSKFLQQDHVRLREFELLTFAGKVSYNRFILDNNFVVIREILYNTIQADSNSPIIRTLRRQFLADQTVEFVAKESCPLLVIFKQSRKALRRPHLFKYSA